MTEQGEGIGWDARRDDGEGGLRADGELFAREDVDEDGVSIPARLDDGERLVDWRSSSLHDTRT
jgi:hypothetical protein